MQVRTATNTLHEIRSANEFGNTDPMRFRLMEQVSTSGVPVTNDRVFGLPSVVQCIRQASQMVAMLPVTVYDESAGPATNRVEATGWQTDLLKNPSLDTSTYNLMEDISACVDGYGNAFIRKLKNRGRVVELRVLDPNYVRVYRDKRSGEKLFDVMTSPTEREDGLTTGDILHVRGFTMSGLVSGLSPIQQFRIALGNLIAIEEFTGRYFANDGSPSGYLSIPDGDLDKRVLDEILEEWMESHSGYKNWGKPAILQAGAKYEQLGVTMADAQFIESRKFFVEDIARMMNWPVELIQPTQSDTLKSEEILLRTMVMYVMPRVQRIKEAFNEDADLFWTHNECLDFDLSILRQADAVSQSTYDLRSRQAGIETANEIRARRGLPPHEDGDSLLSVPVGAGAAGNTDNGDAEPLATTADLNQETGVSKP